jgi:beta-lactam-binding protein with PASTA domain
VHRDIKPGNVMVTRNGDVKVMDFGIARAMSDAQATMTQTAQVIGTAQYLSPEQARGERVDSRSDLYSTGCLLYELLTGRPPFTGDSPVAIAYQHVRENPVPPSRVDPDVPPWADAIVLKAMAKSPADRYQTAADMRADLQRAASGLPVAAAPPTRLDMYPQTQRMGPGTVMAGATSQIPPVEDYDYDYAGRGRGGGSSSRRWIPWVLGLVLVLGVVAAAAYFLLAGSGKTYAVPLVNNQPVAAARQQIAAAHLRSTVVNQPSAGVKSGLVIRSSPAEGNNVPANTLVTLYVSTGPSKVSVPNVQGKQQAAAEAQLQNAGFNVSVQQDTTSTQPAGTVVNQNPASGTMVEPGSKVTIFVSGAASIPNVVGLSQQSAQTSLQSAGFKVSVQTVAGPAGTTPGNVWQQNPTANTTAAPGTTVTILVQPAATPSGSPTATDTGSPTPTASGSTGGNGNGNGNGGGGGGGIPGF